MTRRRLTSDEIALWHKVTETAKKMHPERGREALPLPKPKPTKPPKSRIEPFDLGATPRPNHPRHDVLPGIAERVAAAPLNMDKKAFGRLKRGKLTPEGKLDLHGMTMDQAHPALNRFVLRAHAQGKRLVLVVTGKGKSKPDDGPIPVRMGVLRHNVPHWLATPPLSQVVLQVSEAHLKHGGGGAYYVYLRRHR